MEEDSEMMFEPNPTLDLTLFNFSDSAPFANQDFLKEDALLAADLDEILSSNPGSENSSPFSTCQPSDEVSASDSENQQVSSPDSFEAPPVDPMLALQELDQLLVKVENTKEMLRMHMAQTSPAPSSASASPSSDSCGPDSSSDSDAFKPSTNKRNKSALAEGRPVKRKRNSAAARNVAVGTTAVSLNREQLLSFSSEDLERFVETIRKLRPLTAAEEKEVKRQRRLIKNRESASASRQRKKEYVEELEARIADLTSEKEELVRDNQVLRGENGALREHASGLEKVVKQQNLLRDLWAGMTSLRKSGAASANAKAAGVCLLIVLFSFGLFFNNVGLSGPRLPLDTTFGNMYNPMAPRVVDASKGAAFAGAAMPSGGFSLQNRKLLEVGNSSVSPLRHTDDDEVSATALWKNARVTYLMCAPAEQLAASGESAGEVLVALLVPDNNTKTPEEEPQYTQVACRVLERKSEEPQLA